MKIVVLLRQLSAIRHANLRVARAQLRKPCSQVFHQSLARKTLADAALILCIVNWKSRMLFHEGQYSSATATARPVKARGRGAGSQQRVTSEQ
jgi:hypothetical protein